MSSVVDASYAVAVTWEALADDRLDDAFGEMPLVPPLFLSEIANAALTKVRRGVLSIEDARVGIGYLSDSVTVTDAAPAGISFEVAVEAGLSVHDAAYLACAQAHGVPLWTLDQSLRDAAVASGVAVLP